MASLTTWRRLEPRTRSEGLPGVQARVADPLWMVSLQLRSAELDASDAPSPTRVHLSWEESPITRWATGSPAAGPGTLLKPGQPIESLVDAIPAAVGLRDRALGGQRFRRLLGAELAERYGPALLQDFALPGLLSSEQALSDQAGLRWAALLARRALDGAALRAATGTSDDPRIPPQMKPLASDEAALKKAVSAFVRWWDRNFPTAVGAWDGQRLEAPFSLGASTSSGAVNLTAPGHPGGIPEWHSFSINPGGSMAATDPPSRPQESDTLPTSLTFPGMPASRWWQFEDAAVDLGRLEAAPDDLGRLLLTEFALVYGNDFFMVPMEAAPGSVSRVLSLTVDTSFGEQVSIPSAIAYDTKAKLGRWRMFHCDDGIPDQGTGAGLLVFPPTAIDVMTGPEVEDVLISRDEMANVAWAIERKVRSPLGTPVERRETEYAAHERAGVETSTTSILRYQLSTSVPNSWMPLVPVLGGFVELQGPNTPAGQLLSGGQPYRLQSTEVLRTGRRVTSHTHRARTVKGDVLLWRGWHVRPGRGESSSGLRHDDLTHEEPPPPA